MNSSAGASFLVIIMLMAGSPACVGEIPEVLGKGIISTAAVEYGATVDPIEGTLYFVRTDSAWGEPGCGNILSSTPKGDDWSDPQPFLAGKNACYGDPFVSPDGQLFLFTSNAHDDANRKDDDIWSMRRTRTGWSEPQRVEGVNSTSSEFSPVLTRSGTLYFASDRPGGMGSGDLWLAKPSGKRFAEPKNIGGKVNTKHGEWNLFVDPDETFLIFESSGRADAQSPSGDLYLSWWRDSDWSTPLPARSVNTVGSELMVRPAVDGAQFLFTSTRDTGNAEIYRIGWSGLLGHHRKRAPSSE